MKNYNNWPSKESVQKNRDLYYRQKEQIRRLSPNISFNETASRFGGTMRRRNTSYYKKVVKPSLTELQNHKDYLKNKLKKNFF